VSREKLSIFENFSLNLSNKYSLAYTYLECKINLSFKSIRVPCVTMASAELIAETVAVDVRLAQLVVRAGMPPTPEFDQLIAWLELRIGDHN
jgi:hypothetical protein